MKVYCLISKYIRLYLFLTCRHNLHWNSSPSNRWVDDGQNKSTNVSLKVLLSKFSTYGVWEKLEIYWKRGIDKDNFASTLSCSKIFLKDDKNWKVTQEKFKKRLSSCYQSWIITENISMRLIYKFQHSSLNFALPKEGNTIKRVEKRNIKREKASHAKIANKIPFI